jgi:hypothetical protein
MGVLTIANPVRQRHAPPRPDNDPGKPVLVEQNHCCGVGLALAETTASAGVAIDQLLQVLNERAAIALTVNVLS